MVKPGPDRTVSNLQFLRAVAMAPSPVATVKDIQPIVDMSRAGVNNRLNELESDGYIKSRKVGSAAKIYWLTDKGRKEIYEDARSGSQ